MRIPGACFIDDQPDEIEAYVRHAQGQGAETLVSVWEGDEESVRRFLKRIPRAVVLLDVHFNERAIAPSIVQTIRDWGAQHPIIILTSDETTKTINSVQRLDAHYASKGREASEVWEAVEEAARRSPVERARIQQVATHLHRREFSAALDLCDSFIADSVRSERTEILRQQRRALQGIIASAFEQDRMSLVRAIYRLDSVCAELAEEEFGLDSETWHAWCLAAAHLGDTKRLEEVGRRLVSEASGNTRALEAVLDGVRWSDPDMGDAALVDWAVASLFSSEPIERLRALAGLFREIDFCAKYKHLRPAFGRHLAALFSAETHEASRGFLEELVSERELVGTFRILKEADKTLAVFGEPVLACIIDRLQGTCDQGELTRLAGIVRAIRNQADQTPNINLKLQESCAALAAQLQLAGMETERDFAISLGLRLGLQSVGSLASILDLEFDVSPERASMSLKKFVDELLGSGAQEDAAQLVKDSTRSYADKLRARAEPSVLRTIGQLLIRLGSEAEGASFIEASCERARVILPGLSVDERRKLIANQLTAIEGASAVQIGAEANTALRGHRTWFQQEQLLVDQARLPLEGTTVLVIGGKPEIHERLRQELKERIGATMHAPDVRATGQITSICQGIISGSYPIVVYITLANKHAWQDPIRDAVKESGCVSVQIKEDLGPSRIVARLVEEVESAHRTT